MGSTSTALYTTPPRVPLIKPNCPQITLIEGGDLGGVVYLAHITLGRKKDPFCINIRNPIPQKV